MISNEIRCKFGRRAAQKNRQIFANVMCLWSRDNRTSKHIICFTEISKIRAQPTCQYVLSKPAGWMNIGSDIYTQRLMLNVGNPPWITSANIGGHTHTHTHNCNHHFTMISRCSHIRSWCFSIYPSSSVFLYINSLSNCCVGRWIIMPRSLLGIYLWELSHGSFLYSPCKLFVCFKDHAWR